MSSSDGSVAAAQVELTVSPTAASTLLEAQPGSPATVAAADVATSTAGQSTAPATSAGAESAASATESTVAAATSPVVAASNRGDLVKLAQQAHKNQDAATSRAVHDAKALGGAPEQHGGTGSDYIKSIVFGGIDGTITTFSLIASVVGGSMAVEVVLVLGFANLIADGISMGLGDYLSSKAEYDHLVAEHKREQWEFDNHPQGEIEEMVDVLKGKGIEEEDASVIINTMAKRRDFFVNFMMTEELGLEIPDDPYASAKDGIITFISFFAFGSVPMWVYLILWGAKYSNQGGIFGIACAATALTLFALGVTQGWVARQPRLWQAGLLMTINGSLASAAAYLVGWGIKNAVGKSC